MLPSIPVVSRLPAPPPGPACATARNRSPIQRPVATTRRPALPRRQPRPAGPVPLTPPPLLAPRFRRPPHTCLAAWLRPSSAAIPETPLRRPVPDGPIPWRSLLDSQSTISFAYILLEHSQ